MRIIHKLFALIGAIVLMALVSGCSITASGSYGHPGYADFEFPAWWQANSKFDLSLGSFAIGTTRWLIDEESELDPLFDDLEAIRIHAFEVDNNSSVFKEEFSATQSNLLNAGWHKIAKVTEDDDYTLAFIKSDGDTIDGMVVLILDEDSALFVNLIGNIQPESFTPIMAQLYKPEPKKIPEETASM